MLFLFILPAQILFALFAHTNSQKATLLLLALIPAYLIRFSLAGIPTNLFEVSVFTVFSFSFIHQKIRQQWREALARLPLWAALFIILFILSSLISTFISPHLRTSLGILKGWIFTPLLLSGSVYVFSLKDAKKTFHSRALHSLILSALFVSFLGLIQINQGDRIRSIYDVSNSLALYLTPLLVASFYLTISGYKKLFYLPSAIIIASALIATQSISGITAAASTMLIGIIIYYLSKKPHKKTIIINMFFFLIFFIASIIVIVASGRLAYLTQPQHNSNNHNSVSVRLQLWDISQELIRKRPLLGVGLGTFEPAYQKALHEKFSQFSNCQTTNKNCIKPLAEFVYRDPHNWLLSFWLNMGLLGLISFTLINVVVISVAYVQFKLTPYNINQAAMATILALISLLLFGLTDTIYWKNDLSTLHWTLIALLLATIVRQNKKNKHTATP